MSLNPDDPMYTREKIRHRTRIVEFLSENKDATTVDLRNHFNSPVADVPIHNLFLLSVVFQEMLKNGSLEIDSQTDILTLKG